MTVPPPHPLQSTGVVGDKSKDKTGDPLVFGADVEVRIDPDKTNKKKI